MKTQSTVLAFIIACTGTYALAQSTPSSTGTSSQRMQSQKMGKSPGAQQNAAKSESAVVNFDKGSHALNDQSSSHLKQAISQAESQGRITKVEVAVWSDKSHPASGNLPESDRKLAQQRIRSVEEALKKDMKEKEHITSYNMAENANAIARAMNTSEAQLDAVFAKKELEHITREDFNLIREQGGPSKAVIVFSVEPKK